MSYFLLTLIYFDLLPKYVIVADSIILFPRRVSQIANQFQESHSFCRSDVSWLSYRWSPVYSHTGNQFSAIFSTNFSTKRPFSILRKKQNPLQTAVYRGFLYWANQIRTGECRSQSPVPYRLAIAHYSIVLTSAFPEKHLPETKSFLYSNKNPCYNFYNKDSKVDTGIRTQGLQSHNLAR